MKLDAQDSKATQAISSD